MHALTNCTIYTGEEVLTNYAVLIENEIIVDVVLQEDISKDMFCVDLQGFDLVPGLIDLQLYGGKNGFFVRDLSEESLTDMVQTHRQDGTVGLVPTLYSTSHERILKAIEVTKSYIAAGKTGVLGLHIEGPFINFTKRGAHSANAVRVPTKAEIVEIIASCEGLLTIMTIAPEIWPDELLHLLQESDIILSLGHTNATYEQAKGYFISGVQLATHLYNAMRPFESREPGVVTAIWDTPTVNASIIVDGYHCDYATVRIAKQLMRERLFLISDATLAKIEPMRFEFEDFIANYDGHRLLNDEGKLAGSAITLLDAVRNCIHHVGIPKDEAFRMATMYPAQHLGLGDKFGRIKAGYSADLVVLDNTQMPKSFGTDSHSGGANIVA
ncbi:N-acetylglucosamine-6-phosphate deacetylase [Runella rosea]|uniref:N-acetylglucosamine-6-phosphate deacetylase n=1 Tax=Runella rosea TaxID=2259595 RepID=A0A344TR71_9BACT|nr:N-acetylglucosamine-6-phosphate deacetylase [Runella rosea]AXE21142.1 N-acetylglucosamine-6-phosphate deacetylase [Runella rosea]